MQLAIFLEGGPLMWMMPLQLHVNQKSEYDDDEDNDVIRPFLKVHILAKCIWISTA